MNKGGLGHVEAVLSFVIFIGFLIFAFFFFSPFSGQNRLLDSSLDYTIREVSENSSIFLESYSLVLNTNVPDTILNVQIVPVSAEITNPGVRVEDFQEQVLESGFDGSRVYFNRLSSNSDFITLKFSEDFVSGSLSGGQGLTEGLNYSISSSESRKIYSEKRFLVLKTLYDDDYEKLKEDFNLPGRINFAFSLDFDEGEDISAENFIPENLEVLANQEQIEVIRQSGEIVFADLIVKVW